MIDVGVRVSVSHTGTISRTGENTARSAADELMDHCPRGKNAVAYRLVRHGVLAENMNARCHLSAFNGERNLGRH